MAGPSSVPLIRYDLAYYGIVTQVVNATTFRVAGFAGQGDGVFEGYHIYVLKKQDGTTTAPHGEQQTCTAFVSNTGQVTHAAFTATLAVGDSVLLLHPSVGALGGIDTKIGENTDPAGTNTLFAWMAHIAIAAASPEGLAYHGEVTNVIDAANFQVATLAGMGDFFFAGTYRIYVVRDAGGAGAAPQMEMQACAAYVSATGQFTHADPFTVPLANGDEVMLVHERIAEIADLIGYVGYEGATSLANKLTAARAAFLDAAISSRALEDGGRLQTTEGAVGAIEGATTLHNKLTAARAAFLDAAISTRALEDGGRLQTTEGAVGAIEGATTLHNKLTAVRAALLDQITALRMAQLDPAGLEADIAALELAIAALNDLSADDVRESVCLVGDPADSIGKALYELYVNRLTAARAGYLDRIKNLTRPQNGSQDTTNVLTAIGAAIEDTVPFKVSGMLSLHNMQAGDTFLVVEEIRDRDDATYREYARYSYSDVQTSPMVNLDEKICQGWRVRIQMTAGANRAVTYQFFKEVASA